MGRRISISQPTVINTELIPLEESFRIDANGQLEQWYYDNTGGYAPDRPTTPLVLTPVVNVFDKETNQTYNARVDSARWFETKYDLVAAQARWAQVPVQGRNLLKASDKKLTTTGYTFCYYDFGQISPDNGQIVTITIKGDLHQPTQYASNKFMIFAESLITDIDAHSGNIWSKTFRWDVGELSQIGVGQYFTGGEGEYSTLEWIKLEIGSRPTVYSTAPEDNPYVETEITNTDPTAEGTTGEYVKSGILLYVRKNVPYSNPVNIRCEATYVDPRDQNLLYTVSDSLTLATNRDASVIYPTLKVDAPSSQSFNPLFDNPLYTFVASAFKGDVDVSSSVAFRWYGVNDNGDDSIPIEAFDCYVSGQGTRTLVVNALYAEEIRILLKAERASSTDNPSPDRVYRSILWREPNIDANVISYSGAAVRSNMTDKMRFGTIINENGKVVDDETKEEHLRLNWAMVKNNTGAAEQNLGWGQEVEIAPEDLKASNGATGTLGNSRVFSYIYRMGAYERVQDGSDITDDGELVFDRSVS